MKKKYKKAIVAILIFVAVYIVCVMTAYKFKNGNMDLGNASDILSSLSTFGTFLVAFGAFLKAPDWIKQRKHEAGFALGRELILEKIPLLFSRIEIASNGIYDLRMGIDPEVMQFKITEITTKSMCESNLKIFRENDFSLLRIIELVDKLPRFGWSPKSDTDTQIKNIIKQAQKIRKIHTRLWVKIKIHNEETNPNQQFIFNNDEIIRLIDRFSIAHDEFRDMYSSFNKLYTDVDKYFDIS